MERSKVSAAHPYLAPPVAALSNQMLLDRLGVYWQALGVSDRAQVEALSEQALRRALDLPETAGLEPLTRALLAASELVDDWLAQMLELPRDSREVIAARAALLSGVAPEWPIALFAPPGEADTLRATLREAIAEPTPLPAPSAMPTQRIELFSLLGSLFRWWQKKPNA